MTRFAKRFVIEREIGSGGMARVFLGTDEVLDRPVAVKILNPAHGGTNIGDRFRREGRTAARLSHPNIVQVYDAGEGEFEGREVSYIVMEYVSGGDLKGLIDEKGPLSNSELARLGSEVSSGLAHAHERGIIHRDIKPHNILIDSYGRPKLTDFGIARALDATQATQTGSYLGTALYSSPEQLQGEKATPKSDVYSLGVTLYQAAVGQAPFTGTPIEVASQHINRTPPGPSVLGARLSGGVEAIILDCLQKDPDRRPSAEEVHERLHKEAGSLHNARAYAASPVSTPIERTRTAQPESPPPGSQAGGTRREGRRRRGPIILAATTLLLVLVGAAAFALLGDTDLGLVQAPEQKNQQQSNSVSTEDTQLAGDGEEQTPAGDLSAPEQSGQQASAGSGQGNSDTEAAEAAVQELYDAAAEGDYETFSSLLTASYLNSTWPQATFDGTFATLEQVEFTSGPTAQVNRNTATVEFSTNAYHTNRTDRRTGTATLVRENGEWKISNLSVQPA